VNVDRQLLNSFVVFAEELSFAHAAKRLHLSMPAVHVHVKRLSEALGVALYVRQGRALALTEAGQATLAHAREVATSDARFLASLRGEPRDEPLHIAAGEGTFLYLLGDVLGRAARERLPFSAHVLEGSAIEESVTQGKADLGVGPLAHIPASLEAFRFARARIALALPKAHPLVTKKTLRWRDLRDVPLIVPPRGKPMREMLEKEARAESHPLNVACEARHWPLALHFAKHGVGVAVVNDVCVAPRGLVLRPIEGLPTQDYWCFVRAQKKPNERLARLLGWLREEAKRRRGPNATKASPNAPDGKGE
jgi:DNA-binding transcriptional LysR family regulator